MKNLIVGVAKAVLVLVGTAVVWWVANALLLPLAEWAGRDMKNVVMGWGILLTVLALAGAGQVFLTRLELLCDLQFGSPQESERAWRGLWNLPDVAPLLALRWSPPSRNAFHPRPTNHRVGTSGSPGFMSGDLPSSPLAAPDSVTARPSLRVERSTPLREVAPEEGGLEQIPWGGKCYEDEAYEVFLIDRTGKRFLANLEDGETLTGISEGLCIRNGRFCFTPDGTPHFDGGKSHPAVDLIGLFHDGLAPVCERKSQLCGFLARESFSLAIPCQFAEVGRFREGFAVARLKERWGFLDRKGNFHPCPVGVTQRPRDCHEELAAAQADGKWGYLAPAAEWVIPPHFAWAGDFSEGCAVVGEGGIRPAGSSSTSPDFLGRHRFIARAGTPALPGIFAEAGPFRGGLAPVRPEAASPFWGLIDRAGRLVVPARYDALHPSGGAVVPFRRSGPAPNRGTIPPTFVGLLAVPGGEERMLEDFRDVGPITEGLMPALHRNGRWTYLTGEGGALFPGVTLPANLPVGPLPSSTLGYLQSLALEGRFEIARPFNEGYALVRTAHL